MAYVLVGTATYSSQANRDAAKSRMDAALAIFTFLNRATTFTGGTATSGTTTMTISIEISGTDADAKSAMDSVLSAWTSSNRNTSGWLSLNRV